MSIITVSILLVLVYSLANSNPLACVGLSIIPALALCILLGCLSMEVFSVAWLVMYVVIQFVFPMADNRTVIIGYRSKHLCWAVAVA